MPERTFTVSVPGSTANLGPGFDALGLALDLHLDLSVGPNADGGPSDERHLAIRSFRAAGGRGDVRVRAQFPGGRGLGFSGAARVAGTMAAALQAGADEPGARDEARRRATDMEGHPDNVCASVLGGVVVAAGDQAVPVPIAPALDPAVVLWIPNAETSTKASRTALPEAVPFSDAVFNVGRAALLVAALAAGDAAALRAATQDRLHQDARLAKVPTSRAALDAMLAAGAWGGWLSGSGPSVAALCARATATAVRSAAPSDDARALVVAIDRRGAIVREDGTP